MNKVTFKMKRYTTKHGNKVKMWESYVDGVKNELTIEYVSKDYYNKMFGNEDSWCYDRNYVKNSMVSYAVSALYKNGGEAYIGAFPTLAEAKQRATAYLIAQV